MGRGKTLLLPSRAASCSAYVDCWSILEEPVRRWGTVFEAVPHRSRLACANSSLLVFKNLATPWQPKSRLNPAYCSLTTERFVRFFDVEDVNPRFV